MFNIYKKTKNPISNAIYNMLYAFVERQRMTWNEPSTNIKIDDRITVNWKAKVHGISSKQKVMVVTNIDTDGAIDTVCGDVINAYWVRRV